MSARHLTVAAVVVFAAVATIFLPAAGLDAAPIPQELAERTANRLDGLGGVEVVLIEQDGERLAARGPISSPRQFKSIGKSLLSLAVGVAVEEDLLEGVDQQLVELVPEPFEGLGPEKRAITLEHLLTMSSGLASTSGEAYGAWVAQPDWTRAALEQELLDGPGEAFRYSTGNYHLLAAALAAVAGDVEAFVGRAVLRPAGAELAGWPRSPEGIPRGGNDMSLSSADLAKVGRMVVSGGSVGGEQVVPASWIERSTTRHAEGWPDRYGAYGYGWWLREDAGFEVWLAVGYGSSYLYLAPELDLVVVVGSTLVGKGEPHDARAFAILGELLASSGD